MLERELTDSNRTISPVVLLPAVSNVNGVLPSHPMRMRYR